MSLIICCCPSGKDLTQPRLKHVLVTLWPIDWLIRRFLVNASVQWQCEFNCLCCNYYDKIHTFSLVNSQFEKGHDKRSPERVSYGVVRSFHKRQKQMKSKMKELILIRLSPFSLINFWTPPLSTTFIVFK